MKGNDRETEETEVNEEDEEDKGNKKWNITRREYLVLRKRLNC